MNNYKLTIALITMNRREQLIEALNSCLECNLPEATEFVILDNASTDETWSYLECFKEENQHQYSICIHHSKVNLGVAGGRNFCFQKAQGEFVYFMDDDAVISDSSKDFFFIKSIEYLEKNCNVASLTTMIKDEIFGESRLSNVSKKTIDSLPLHFFFLGGSHFLRKSSFSSPLYFNIMYGSEEYVPSILAMENGYYHVVMKDISIVHKPKFNKWVIGSAERQAIDIKCLAVTYISKRKLYPFIFYPILFLMLGLRIFMYIGNDKKRNKELWDLIKKMNEDNHVKKVRIITVLRMFFLFGPTVF